MSKNIHCGFCQYYERSYQDCMHINNEYRKFIKEDWYGVHESVGFKRKPSEINKEMNCSWYTEGK